jgi:ethanolamine utilization protein EutQ (cupin superfamily)
MKYVIAGDIVFTDGNGQRVVAKAGEVVYIPKGATSKLSFPWNGVPSFLLCLQSPLRASREARLSM